MAHEGDASGGWGAWSQWDVFRLGVVVGFALASTLVLLLIAWTESRAP